MYKTYKKHYMNCTNYTKSIITTSLKSIIQIAQNKSLKIYKLHKKQKPLINTNESRNASIYKGFYKFINYLILTKTDAKLLAFFCDFLAIAFTLFAVTFIKMCVTSVVVFIVVCIDWFFVIDAF